MSESPTAKNLRRITESVEQHDESCEAKAKAVMLCPFELDRLGFDHITTKSGRRVPIKADDTLGTGRLRVICDGYHGPKREEEVEDTIEAPAPAERELVPAGMPGEKDELHTIDGETWSKLTVGQRGGKKIAMERMCLAYEEHHPNAVRVQGSSKIPGLVMYRDES